jgi:hypothetical protein
MTLQEVSVMRRLVLFAALALVLALPMSAHAGLILYLSSDGDTHFIADQSSDDSNPTVGAITYSQAVGTFSVNVTTGLSKPVLGTAARGLMDLNSTLVGSGSILLGLTDTDFTGTGSTAFASSIGGTTRGSSVEYDTFVDPTNTEFGTSMLLASQVFAPAPLVAFSGSSVDVASLDGPMYSLTQLIFVDNGESSRNTSFDAELKVPEPGTMTLLGMGFLTLGFARRRRP